VHVLVEAESLAVELDRGVHVVDDVATLTLAMGSSLGFLLVGTYACGGSRSRVSGTIER
jgi:hypothetical protein